MFLAQALGFQEGGGLTSLLLTSAVFLFVIFFFYIFYSVTLMLIARRTHTPGAGLAWIPIANLFLMCRIARRPAWWALMCFVPILNLLFFTMLWMAIAEACGKSIFLGILAIIPILGMLILAYLALTATPRFAANLSSNCPSCSTPIIPGESFCRECGQSAPTVVKSVRQTSSGKLALLATGAALPVFLLFGIVGWFSISSALAYSPPERKAPAMPERTSGTLTEFPVDTAGDTQTEPGSIVVDDLQNTAGKTQIATNIPQKRLPPGLTRDSLKKRASTATSAVYRPKTKLSQTTVSTTTAPEIYICVLRVTPGQTKVGEAMATEIVKASSGRTRTGTRVNSPRGGVYVGSRISDSQTNVYVLEKQSSDVVILIYSPTPAGNEIAARLAGNVGNGEGVNDYPTVKDTLWTLPQRPANLTLVDFYTQTRDEMGLSQDDLNKARTDEESSRIIDYFSQFIPERATTARYRDSQGKLWEVGVYDYETSRRAWNIWMFLKWTVGFGLQPATVKNDSALYSDTDEGRVLMFQRGMYLVVVKAPNGTPIETVATLGNEVQV